MKIPFGTITITKETKTLVNEVLDSGNLSCGQKVREFENKFAALVGVKEAIAVSSGTDALIIALSVLYEYGAQRGDEVIVPAMTFIATANAILAAGFTPVFADIEKHTLNINTDEIQKLITKRTVAILPVHLMGKPADMDTINNIAQRNNIKVIEDAAEAHGAKYKGKHIGSLGNMTCYSLYVAHIITSIEGGIITTNNSKEAGILRSLRSHGRACKCNTCVLNKGESCKKRFKENQDIRFSFERAGFSCKMNELEAAVGLASLSLYQETIQTRRNNLLTLINDLKQFNKYFYVIEEEKWEEIGPHAFPILIKEDVPFTRDEFVCYLNLQGIDTRNLFSCIPTQCKGYEFLQYRVGDFPISEYIGDNALHIGVHQDLSRPHLEYIIKIITNFLETLI